MTTAARSLDDERSCAGRDIDPNDHEIDAIVEFGFASGHVLFANCELHGWAKRSAREPIFGESKSNAP